MTNDTAYAAISAQVALALLGEPPSRRGSEWRYRRRGSLKVDTAAGTWFDHEATTGGGVLDLVMHVLALDRAGAVRWLREGGYLDHAPRAPVTRPQSATPPDPRRAPNVNGARLSWDYSQPVPDTLAATYLHHRNVPDLADCPALRYAARCRHLDGTIHPALIAAAILDGRFVAVQRTWLRADGAGKAALDPPRASLGATKGAAVRLRDPLDGRLLVAEGVKTAGAAAKVLGWEFGVWAALGTALRSVAIPADVHHVLIAGDRDHNGAGLWAAADLGRQLESGGCTVEIHVPDKIGMDFADVLAEVASCR